MSDEVIGQPTKQLELSGIGWLARDEG